MEMRMGDMTMGPGGMQMGNMSMWPGGMQMGGDGDGPQREAGWNNDVRRNIGQLQAVIANQNRQMHENINQMQSQLAEQNRAMSEQIERQNRLMQQQMQAGERMFSGPQPSPPNFPGWTPAQPQIPGATGSQAIPPSQQQQQSTLPQSVPIVTQYQHNGLNPEPNQFQNPITPQGLQGGVMQCLMSQNGVQVGRMNDTIYVNGREVYRIPLNGPCSISQMNSNVYVNGILVYTPPVDDGSSLMMGGLNVQRGANGLILVNGLEVARVPHGEPCAISQSHGQVFVNGRCVYPPRS